jgi:hypothetical protein
LVSGDHPSGPNHNISAPACPEVLWRGRFAEVANALGKRSWEIWAGIFAALAAVAHRQVHLRYHGHLYGMAYVLEFIPIKPSVARASDARESYAARSRLP